MAKKAGNRNPLQPTLLEELLQGHPGEYMDVVHGAQPESDRHYMISAAERWVTNAHLEAPEAERIRKVWLEGQYQRPLNVDRERREILRALILPRRRPEGRPDAEQLQAAMGGTES